jgi:hypothetical protein
MTLLPPHCTHPRRGSSGGRGCHLPSPAGGQGHWGKITQSCPRPRFKSTRQANHGRQATNPIGVFSSPSHLLAPGEKGKGTRRRRAAPGKGGREPARSEEPELRRTTAGVDIYPACAHPCTEPATTTSPPHREHRTATLFSPPPWSLSCDDPATLRRVAL